MQVDWKKLATQLPIDIVPQSLYFFEVGFFMMHRCLKLRIKVMRSKFDGVGAGLDNLELHPFVGLRPLPNILLALVATAAGVKAVV